MEPQKRDCHASLRDARNDKGERVGLVMTNLGGRRLPRPLRVLAMTRGKGGTRNDKGGEGSRNDRGEELAMAKSGGGPCNDEKKGQK